MRTSTKKRENRALAEDILVFWIGGTLPKTHSQISLWRFSVAAVATAGSVHRSPGNEFLKKYVLPLENWSLVNLSFKTLFQSWCSRSCVSLLDLGTWGTQFILVSFMDDGCSNRCLLEVFYLPSMNLFYVTEKNCSWSKQIMRISKRWRDHRHLSGKHRSISYHSCLRQTSFGDIKTETLSAWLHRNSPFRVLSIQSFCCLDRHKCYASVTMQWGGIQPSTL